MNCKNCGHRIGGDDMENYTHVIGNKTCLEEGKDKNGYCYCTNPELMEVSLNSSPY